jgi:hypothetical protein
MTLSFVQRAARLTSWLVVLALVILSVVPGDMRPHTGLPGAVEHFGLYLAVCALLAVGYERRVAASVVALVLSLAAANLELVQLLVPHRYPGWLDVAASAGGAFAGAGLARLFLVLWRRYLEKGPA